jgi:hypothetical protein
MQQEQISCSGEVRFLVISWLGALKCDQAVSFHCSHPGSHPVPTQSAPLSKQRMAAARYFLPSKVLCLLVPLFILRKRSQMLVKRTLNDREAGPVSVPHSVMNFYLLCVRAVFSAGSPPPSSSASVSAAPQSKQTLF